jgi:alpha-amylase
VRRKTTMKRRKMMTRALIALTLIVAFLSMLPRAQAATAKHSVNTPDASMTSIYPTMNLRGGMNSWGTTPMTLIGPDTWQVAVTLTPNTAYIYKYDAYGDWAATSNWGASGTAGVAAVNSQNNISFTSGSGTSYNFTFNDSTLAYSVTPATATVNPNLNPPYTSVQLFRWSWNDIAQECTQFLGPHGYGGVQISPPQASLSNVGVTPAVWWNMYQPVNYTSLTSDMGTAAELQTMINTCHAAGVRVYADVVTNQMAGGKGTAPSGATDGTSSWTSVPPVYPNFSASDFHTPTCGISSNDYNGQTTLSDASDPNAAAASALANFATEYPGGISQYDTQNCELEGMPDVATENPATQAKIAAYMDLLLSMGIDGFRIDAAKHQQEFAMAQIFAAAYGVQALTNEGEAPWVTQEVLVDGESNPRSQFSANGAVQEFQFSTLMQQALRGEWGSSLSTIPAEMGTPGNWGGTWSFDDSSIVQTLVDDWDTERNNGNSLNASDFVTGDPNDATTSYMYDLANIFMLASPYGEMAQVQSGYRFTDENAAPAGCAVPSGSSATVCTSAFVGGVAQVPTSRTTPTSGFDFIHRWTDIANMVGFNTATHGTSMNTWTVGTNNQIAFSRAPSSDITNGIVTAGTALGFVALNNDTTAWKTTFATGLPAGTYCNVINGTLSGPLPTGTCTADVVVVDASGNAAVTVPAQGIPGQSAVPAIAIYVGQTEGAATSAPVAPAGLTATAASSSSINLAWTASAGATTYTVYRSTSKTGTFSSIGTPSSLSYSDSGLTPSTAYYYYVTATNTAGTSAASSTVTATTNALPIPAAPTGLTATPASSSSISLAWTASTNATSYTVSRSTSATGTFAAVGTPSTTSFTDTGLTAATTYYYYVTATDTAGTSPASSTASATTASASAFTATYPTMDLRGSMNSWGTTSMSLIANDTWQAIVTLTPNTTYAYKYDAFGNWSNSSSWGASGTTGVAALSPVSSGNINFTSGSGTTYSFTFNDSTLAYSVEAVTVVLPTFTITGTSNGISNMLTVTDQNSATATISITPENGFSAPVTFACVGLPANTACFFSPSSVTPVKTTAVTTTLTVSKTGTGSALNRTKALYPASVLAALFCCFSFRRRKMLQRLLLLVVCILVMATANGCGAIQYPSSTMIGVTATSGSGSNAIQQTMVFPLTVK